MGIFQFDDDLIENGINAMKWSLYQQHGLKITCETATDPHKRRINQGKNQNSVRLWPFNVAGCIDLHVDLLHPYTMELKHEVGGIYRSNLLTTASCIRRSQWSSLVLSCLQFLLARTRRYDDDT